MTDKFLAPDSTYDALHSCCQYDREAKEEVVMDAKRSHDHEPKTMVEVQVSNQLEAVYTNYFHLRMH
jgi:hypothetical protein